MIRRVFLLTALLLITTAQTPVPAPPLRHLVYNVTVNFSNPAQDVGYSGVSSKLGGTGGIGTITVDVLSAANDGGLVVRADVLYQHEVRPADPVTCAIYGDGRVICPPASAMSTPVNVILSLLGRYFYDPSAVATDGTWSTHFESDNVKSNSHFVRKSAPDTNPVVIDEHTIVTAHSLQLGWTSDTHITYDASMSVPDAVHDVATAKGPTGENEWTTTDLTLASDSFAKKN
jgi:hypothetical protein